MSDTINPTVISDVTPEDAEWIARAIEVWDVTERWSLRGQTPSPEFIHDLLTRDVVMQRKLSWGTTDPCGILQLASTPDLGVAQLEILINPLVGTTSALRCCRLFVRRMKASTPKMCIHTLGNQMRLSDYLGHRAEPAGILRAHVRDAVGSYTDLCIYEIWPPTDDQPGDA